jgi:5'-phosphate synthase pdxT subunit
MVEERSITIGVLAIQGGVIEHIQKIARIGAVPKEVRLPEDLRGLDGLILPGGESTTIGKLAVRFGLVDPIREFAKNHAVWGTCAGAILMAKDTGSSQPLLGLLDITVRRNAFGRQVDSFEIDLDVPALASVSDGENRPFHAIFIRGPRIEDAGPQAEILVTLPDGSIVGVRQGLLMATAFHPELSRDDRFHRYFRTLIQHG